MNANNRLSSMQEMPQHQHVDKMLQIYGAAHTRCSEGLKLGEKLHFDSSNSLQGKVSNFSTWLFGSRMCLENCWREFIVAGWKGDEGEPKKKSGFYDLFTYWFPILSSTVIIGDAISNGTGISISPFLLHIFTAFCHRATKSIYNNKLHATDSHFTLTLFFFWLLLLSSSGALLYLLISTNKSPFKQINR